MNTFYLVRHGQTVWNTLGKTQGHGDSPLTNLGVSQAENLGEALKDFPIDIVYSSDLGRAVQTAEIISEKLGKKSVPTPLLREMGFGIWEGMQLKKIEETYPEKFNLWRHSPDKLEIEGGETLNHILDRQKQLIEELNNKYENKHILLVSHSVTVRVMLLHFLDSSVKNLYRIKIDNTALNIVEYRNYGPVVIKINDTTHLNNGELIDEKQAKSALE